MKPLIRLAEDRDAARCRAIYAPCCAEDCAISFELAPPSIEEMQGRIHRILAQYPWLVCERNGEVLGYAYAGVHNERAAYRWSVNTSVYVGETARGLGVGRALYTALFSILRRQNYVNAYAGITLPNSASVGLHASMDFRPVGVYEGVGYKVGAWHDVVWMHRPLRERPAEPESPRNVREVAGTAAWDEGLAAGLACLRPGIVSD